MLSVLRIYVWSKNNYRSHECERLWAWACTLLIQPNDLRDKTENVKESLLGSHSMPIPLHDRWFQSIEWSLKVKMEQRTRMRNPAKKQKSARNMFHRSQKTGQNLEGSIVSTEGTQGTRLNNVSTVIHRRHSVQRLCTAILVSIFIVNVLDTGKEASAPFHKRKDRSELPTSAVFLEKN